MELGQRIKDKRKAERISAEGLALKLGLGLSKDNIYKWERGSKPSDPEQYQKLMEWLENGKSQNGNDSNYAPVRPQEAQHAPDYKDRYIQLLEELANSNGKQLLQLAKMNQALLKTLLRALATIQAKAEKRKLSEILIELNNQTEQYLLALRKEGT